MIFLKTLKALEELEILEELEECPEGSVKDYIEKKNNK